MVAASTSEPAQARPAAVGGRVGRRLLVVAAAAVGLAGLILGALAAHGPGDPVAMAALLSAERMLLVHGAAGLALALAARVPVVGARWLAAAATLMLAGAVLFAGPIALTRLAGIPALNPATPFGGVLMMAGWVLAALGGAARR